MVSLHDKRQFARNRSMHIQTAFVFLIIAVFVIFIFKFVLVKFAYKIDEPLVLLGQETVRATRGLFSTKAELLQSIDSLRSENSALRSDLVNMKLLQEENLALKNLKEKQETHYIVAGVVAKPANSAYDTLILDRGEHDGISVGMRVYGFSGVYLGSISSVTISDSTVTLHSTAGNSFNAEILLADATNSVPAVMRGRGGGAFETILPKDVILNHGALAVFMGSVAHPFAEVVRTVERSDTADQIVYLRSIENMQYLRYVVVKQ